METRINRIWQARYSAKPNMALMTWSGSRVRKQDVIIAKNDLIRSVEGDLGPVYAANREATIKTVLKGLGDGS